MTLFGQPQVNAIQPSKTGPQIQICAATHQLTTMSRPSAESLVDKTPCRWLGEAYHGLDALRPADLDVLHHAEDVHLVAKSHLLHKKEGSTEEPAPLSSVSKNRLWSNNSTLFISLVFLVLAEVFCSCI